MNQFPHVLIVIVNYRTAALTINCLRSLANEINALDGIRAVIVDNASDAESVEQIRAALQTNGWENWATLLPLARNGGYAVGNNAALRAALQSATPPAYFWLLNSDTVVRAGALQALVNFMNAHPEVGIAGSRLEEADGTPQISAFRFPSIASDFDLGLRVGFVSKLLSRWWIAPPVSDEPCRADWVPGASVMVRRAVFESIGLLDPEYFLYFEDVDLCRRALDAGWPCWYVPQSRVIHLVGKSSGVTDLRRPLSRLPRYWFDSRRHYFLKHHGWRYAALADSAWLLGTALCRIRRALEHKPVADRPERLSEIFFNSVLVKRAEDTEH